MNCPDCDAPMRQEDAPPDGGWPQVVYVCPACYPDYPEPTLALTEDVEHVHPTTDVKPTGGKL